MAQEDTEEVTPASTPAPVIVSHVQSESLKYLAPALLKAQKNLENPEKNAKNPHFGNRYADLGACMKAATDALNAEGCTLIQAFAQAQYGTVAVTTLVLHQSGEYIGGTCVIPLDRDNAQGYGSAATYARRYGVSAILGIVAEDDDDGNAASARANDRPAPGTLVKKSGLFGKR